MKIRNIIFFVLIFISLNLKSQNFKWEKVLDNFDYVFVGIDNADSNYCMAVANLHSSAKGIIKSIDGGNTWNLIYKDTFDMEHWPLFKVPFDIAYPTRDFCIVSCDSNFLFRTKDGGKTWVGIRTYDLLFAVRGFFQISMLDNKNGLAIAHKGLALTHNGFDSMEVFLGPYNYFIFCASLVTPNSICVLSRDTKVIDSNYVRFFRSEDGGKTWIEYDFPDFSNPSRLKFVDSLTGFVAGGNDTGIGQQESELIFKTIDGGKTWFKVLDTVIGCSFGLQQLDFYDKENGIAVGQCGAVFWTHDGGNSWAHNWDSTVMYNLPPTQYVSYIRKNRAIIVNFVGSILISEDTATDVVEEIPNDDDFVLYPNPSSVKIKIKLKDIFINSTEIKIFNRYGQEIINKPSSDSGLLTSGIRLIEVDVSLLSPGAYFLTYNKDGKFFTKPFIVMR